VHCQLDNSFPVKEPIGPPRRQDKHGLRAQESKVLPFSPIKNILLVDFKICSHRENQKFVGHGLGAFYIWQRTGREH
jgi:hypothetical protein